MAPTSATPFLIHRARCSPGTQAGATGTSPRGTAQGIGSAGPHSRFDEAAQRIAREAASSSGGSRIAPYGSPYRCGDSFGLTGSRPTNPDATSAGPLAQGQQPRVRADEAPKGWQSRSRAAMPNRCAGDHRSHLHPCPKKLLILIPSRNLNTATAVPQCEYILARLLPPGALFRVIALAGA